MSPEQIETVAQLLFECWKRDYEQKQQRVSAEPRVKEMASNSTNGGSWIKEFPAAITVCDPQGIILAMNEKSCATFEKEGGAKLIGTDLLECHPEPARTKLSALMKSKSQNVYTIEMAGMKKLIYQSPWYKDGQYAGFVELSIPIPDQMPHFVRDGSL
jgi:sensor histidine kinase regulating citrate/malate metabolism